MFRDSEVWETFIILFVKLDITYLRQLKMLARLAYWWSDIQLWGTVMITPCDSPSLNIASMQVHEVHINYNFNFRRIWQSVLSITVSAVSSSGGFRRQYQATPRVVQKNHWKDAELCWRVAVTLITSHGFAGCVTRKPWNSVTVSQSIHERIWLHPALLLWESYGDQIELIFWGRPSTSALFHLQVRIFFPVMKNIGLIRLC